MAASHIDHVALRVLFALSLTFSLFAFASPVWSSLRSEVNQFHEFLQSHPRVSAELRTNPNLVNSKRYLDKHDDLAGRKARIGEPSGPGFRQLLSH